MNLDYILRAAKALADKGENESRCGMDTARRSFTQAAEKYRQAAALDPTNSQNYISLAESYEQKSSQPIVPHQAPPPQRGPVTPPPDNKTKGGTTEKPVAKVTEAKDLTMEEAMAKLNSLTGLTKVKEQVQTYTAIMENMCDRRNSGQPVPDDFSYHLVFKGNPGTGKTTVARLMGQIFKALGMLEKGHLVETSRSDLVAGYVGQTAIKTREVLESALDGVLFIDEAYRLSQSEGGNDFGKEAIEEILPFMDNNRDRLIVIIAGYDKPIDGFIETNAGLKSRFTNTIQFEDYTPDELMSIFKGLCKKNGIELEPAAESILFSHFQKLFDNRDEHFGNGRTVRNTFQGIFAKQSIRLQKMRAKAPESVTMEIKNKFVAEDVLEAIGGGADTKTVEYMRTQKETDDSVIFGYLAQNNLGAAATALCSRLESLLKHVYGYSGELYEMVNQLRASNNERAKIISKQDYDCIYRIRTFRNAHVHSGSPDVQITTGDISDFLKIVKSLE